MTTASVGWAEYLVFVLVLLVSVGIGIFYGCFGSRQKSAKEFLLANRQMHAFPVALSQICTTISAITLLAHPVEIYLYGFQYTMLILSYIPFSLCLLYLYIPVYFNLNVNSAYEYIEMRFSATVRLIISLLAIIHVITSMAIAIYAPSLAIEQVTGISTEVSTAVIYAVCIFYSALGGLKAVLWSDVFQSFIMLASLLIIAGKGLADIGGFSVMWDRALAGNRLNVLNFDPDPRTRHTVWTCIIGSYLLSLPFNTATQLQVQRILSMPDMKTVKKSMAINLAGMSIIILSCSITGLIIFAKYYDCDPLSTKAIEKSDQLVPYFVMETVDGIPGLLGLFIAGLTCASMSSLSSGLSALASITTYDYVRKMFPNLSDIRLSTISKINTFLLGLTSYGFVFVVQNMGSILPASSSILGIMLSPVFGLFTLGMMFPWANSKGSMAGMILAFIIMIAYVILTNIFSTFLPNQKLAVSTDQCPKETQDLYANSTIADWNWKAEAADDSFFIKTLSVSYMWYSAAGIILSIGLGLVFSILVNLVEGKPRLRISSRLLSPPVASFYFKYFPNHIQQWVEYKLDDHSNGSDINLAL